MNVILLALNLVVIDKIAAIVGDKIITLQDVEEAMLFFPQKVDRKEILNQMIEQKLLLIEAERETINLKEDEINNALQNALLQLKSNFPSDEEYKKELEKIGITEDMLIQKYRKNIKNQLTIQKLMQKKFGDKLYVSDVEGVTFFNENIDSIPKIPASIKMFAIQIDYKISEKAKIKAKNKVQEIIKLINKESFDVIAKKYSDDPATKEKGGYLGIMNKNELDRNFEMAIEHMNPNDIKIIEKENSIFIIKLHKKYDDKVELSVILQKILPTKEDSQKIELEIEEAKNLIEKEEKPENYKIISWAEGFIPIEETQFYSIDEVELNKIYVFNIPTGYQIIKPIEKQKERTPTWNEVRLDIKNFIYQKKLESCYNELINKLRNKIFIKLLL